MTRSGVLGMAGADTESDALETGTSSNSNNLHTSHRIAPTPHSPVRGVVARRSSRIGDPNSSLSQMVRISSKAAKRHVPLLPNTTRRSAAAARSNKRWWGCHNNYRFLVVLVGSMLTILSVGFVIFFVVGTSSPAATHAAAREVQVGPDGQILQQHGPQQRHERQHQRNEAEEQPVESKEGDDRQGEDDRQQVTEGGGDDGTTSADQREEEEEEEDEEQPAPPVKEEEDDDESDEGGTHHSNNNDMKIPMILPAHRVLSSGLPYLLYGTAWKKNDTARLVKMAVTAGFRFIDTACQPRHYHEKGVGDGWTVAANELELERRDLFIQTKYTSVSGQDPNNIPYDPAAPLPEQVAESLQVSLRNLRTTYLDSWVMHGLESNMEDTMVVYRAMEEAVDQGRVVRLGISNCYDIDKFKYIYDHARIKPEVLQNRFYGDSYWDVELRRFCQKHDIWYQSFWTLTANRDALNTREAIEWAARKNLTPQTLLYAYLMNTGYGTPLDGTTNWDHMVEDVAVMQRMQKEFQGSVADEDKIFANAQEMRDFEQLLGF